MPRTVGAAERVELSAYQIIVAALGVPGALLWAVGLLGFIAAVTGPLNVQVLVAAVLFAGRGFVLLMTSEVEGR